MVTGGVVGGNTGWYCGPLTTVFLALNSHSGCVVIPYSQASTEWKELGYLMVSTIAREAGRHPTPQEKKVIERKLWQGAQGPGCLLRGRSPAAPWFTIFSCPRSPFSSGAQPCWNLCVRPVVEIKA